MQPNIISRLWITCSSLSDMGKQKSSLALKQIRGTLHGKADETSTCQFHNMSAHTHITAQNAGVSGRNSMWLKFTASEDKPHAPTAIFSSSFPRKRESRDFRD